MDKNIQYILEVARCGGITKAANKLYITPSALSRFVQARESELNVLLFHRVGKTFYPDGSRKILHSEMSGDRTAPTGTESADAAFCQYQ